MSVLNESDYKAIYNVAQCAGITDFSTEPSTIYENYNKIANWINGHEILSKIFTANVDILKESERYRLQLITSTGAGILYGYREASNTITCGSHTAKSYRYAITTSANTSMTKVTEEIPLLYLNLILIKSTHGFIADIYNSSKANYYYSVRLVQTIGIDDTGITKDITMFADNDLFYSIIAPISYCSANGYLYNNSYSEKTGLFTLMVPGRDILCENVKLCEGRIIDNLTFFEAGGKTWCCVVHNNTSKGLALLIE